MLSLTGRTELAAMREICPGQLRLHLPPGGLVLTDSQSAHQLGGNGWTLLGTIHTVTVTITVTVTVTVTVTSYIDVDKVILWLYEGVKGDHLEVQYEHKVVDTEEE